MTSVKRLIYSRAESRKDESYPIDPRAPGGHAGPPNMFGAAACQHAVPRPAGASLKRRASHTIRHACNSQLAQPNVVNLLSNTVRELCPHTPAPSLEMRCAATHSTTWRLFSILHLSLSFQVLPTVLSLFPRDILKGVGVRSYAVRPVRLPACSLQDPCAGLQAHSPPPGV